MRKLTILIFFITCGFWTKAKTQYAHIPVFEQLSGKQLLDSLVVRYKSYALMSYSDCRDTLFSKIDMVNDSLECIYTGMKRYLPPGEDPTTAVLMNGQPNGINTEHAYPQSKGANGYGRSDLHHLYPTRIKANTDRMSNPMGEIKDSETRIWYYLTTELTSPPATNRDLYSESITTRFEPRESVKGDIARSIFYFYTMYRHDANSADPLFFNSQLSDLCSWHYYDPVDQKEWDRTHKIAQYQGNVNPYVLDCSLVSRAFCNNLSQECEYITSTSKNSKILKLDVQIYPNPSTGTINIQFNDNIPNESMDIKIYDISGKLVLNFPSMLILNSESQLDLNGLLVAGFYIVYITNKIGKKVGIHKLLVE